MSTTKASPAADLKAQLDAIAALQPSGRLDALVRWAREFSPEAFHTALPSTQMGPEGPVLVRVALVSASYFVDLHLATADLEFDFTLLRTVKNYRVSLGEVSIKVNEQDRRYQTARIQMMYGAASVPLVAELTYVGMDRAQWLDQVKTALPVATVLSD